MPPKGAKRAVSSHNVGAKRAKMGKDMQALVEKERGLQWHQDFQWVTQHLNENPEKLASVVAVLKCEGPASFNPDMQISPEYLKCSFTRLPTKDLLEFFSRYETFDVDTFKKIVKGDAKILAKVLQRLCVLPNSLTIWSHEKAVLSAAFHGRMNSLGMSPDCTQLRDGPEVDWQASGLYQFRPHYDPAAANAPKPHDHIYEEIVCGDLVASLTGFVVVRATCKVHSNWSLQDATLVRPDRNDFQPKCVSFFQQAGLDDSFMAESKSGGVPLVPAALSQPKQLCLEDDKLSTPTKNSTPRAIKDDSHTDDGSTTTPAKSPSSVAPSLSPSSPEADSTQHAGPPEAPPSKAALAQKRLRSKVSVK